jgi:predicted dehydrogenase
MSIHHFDLARMFCRRNAQSVYAEEFNPAGSWYKGDVAANCLFEMAGGIRFAYRGSWCAEGLPTSWNGDWRIIGERGTLLYAADKEPTGEIISGTEGFQRARSPMPISSAEVKKTGMCGALNEMLTFLRTGRMPQTECHDNIHSLAMVLGAIESSKAGKRIQISGL